METTQLQDKTIQTESKNLFKEGDTISGSQALLDALVAEGVHTIFGYPGGAIMPIYDALYDFQDTLKHILVRHEQGGIHAAQDMPVRVGRSALRLQQAVRGYQFSNRISRCSDRFYAACMYYRASICTSFRNRCISGN